MAGCPNTCSYYTGLPTGASLTNQPIFNNRQPSSCQLPSINTFLSNHATNSLFVFQQNQISFKEPCYSQYQRQHQTHQPHSTFFGQPMTPTTFVEMPPTWHHSEPLTTCYSLETSAVNDDVAMTTSYCYSVAETSPIFISDKDEEQLTSLILEDYLEQETKKQENGTNCEDRLLEEIDTSQLVPCDEVVATGSDQQPPQNGNHKSSSDEENERKKAEGEKAVNRASESSEISATTNSGSYVLVDHDADHDCHRRCAGTTRATRTMRQKRALVDYCELSEGESESNGSSEEQEEDDEEDDENTDAKKTTRKERTRRQMPLWRFLLRLLVDNEHPDVLAWTNEDRGEFRLINVDGTARLWGIYKGYPRMDYAKLARGLRYYYPKGIIKKTHHRRYSYRFTINNLSRIIHDTAALSARTRSDEPSSAAKDESKFLTSEQNSASPISCQKPVLWRQKKLL